MFKLYTIHQFSELCQVSAQTLRNWDNLGKLKPYLTGPSGYRYYSEEQLRELIKGKEDQFIKYNKEKAFDIIIAKNVNIIKLKNSQESKDYNSKISACEEKLTKNEFEFLKEISNNFRLKDPIKKGVNI